jgi:hypothetical protein
VLIGAHQDVIRTTRVSAASAALIAGAASGLVRMARSRRPR